jgi:3-oxoadipate enol-lactonase
MTRLVHNHLGCPLAYEVRGKGPPVVLIQGAGVHGSGWKPQVDVLEHDYECLTFDNRGIGASQPAGDCALTIEQMSDDVCALLDAQKWDSAHVIGHSMGGLIALQFALENRPRVRSLSLLCTFADGRMPNRLTPWLVWTGMCTRIGTRRARRNAFLKFVTSPQELRDTSDPDSLAERLAALFGHDLADHPPVTMRQLGAMKRFDATPRLGELSGIPTLVVSAEHDRLAPTAAGKLLAKGIPGSRHVELAGVGHGVPLLQTERVNQLLLEHLLLGDDVHFKDELEAEGETWMQDA